VRWGSAGLLLVVLIAVTACGSPGTLPETEEPVPALTSTSVATTTTSTRPTTTTTTTTASRESRLAECVASLVPGSSAVPCEGAVYDLAIPEDCPDRPCGLIVDYPPGQLTGAQTDAYTNLKALGTAAGYVVVQPNSGRGALSAGRDRAFFDALIAALGIDASRVHVGGASLGGWQTWHFICDHADLIASAAPHASGAGNMRGESCDFDDNRSPVEQVDILMSHGRNDSVVLFERGVSQLELVVDSWGMTESEVLVDDTDYQWTRWTNDQGTVLEFLEFDWTTPSGEGHCYPGGVGSGGCGIDTPIHYGEAALAFYIAHPKDG
jgi:poly(3-hydroxybutyrate) depolymerase